MSILLGIAGNASGAGGFQRWYHNVFVVSDPPTWRGEMENILHANLYVSYRREWQLAPNTFSISLVVQPELAFGTRDIYAHTDLIPILDEETPYRAVLDIIVLDLPDGKSFSRYAQDFAMWVIMRYWKEMLWVTILFF